jgi:hypothetical protein
MTGDAKKLRFSAALGRITQNRCLDVPRDVSDRLCGGKRIRVTADVLGIGFESTLVPRAGGGHRLFVPSQVWRALGLDTGDIVPVTLVKAATAPAVAPEDLARALRKTPHLAAEYARLTPADRRQIVKWLDAARASSTRRRRVEEISRRLGERASQRAR